MYEKKHGPLLPGEIIRFEDGDRLNFDISNLKKVTRAEHAYLNILGHDNSPPELRPTISLIAKIQAKNNQLSKAAQ